MHNNSLKSKAIKGIAWSAIDKFIVQLVQFAISLVLARMLMPEDFGLIGMLNIFIVISQTFIESGLGTGVIQRQNRTDLDFSTLFVFNIGISCLFYLLLFFLAPFIASFYQQPQLIDLTRILGLLLIINAFGIVQRTKLTIAVNFKFIALSNITGVLLGGLFGLLAVFKGYGVWSLVIQTLSGSLGSAIFLWFFGNWKPSIKFSRESFNSLFHYGSKLLIAGLYAQILNNIYNIFIGKFYPVASLGYYTRTKNFADISSGIVVGVFQQATFPLLTEVQNHKEKLISIYSRTIRMSAFINFPLMTILALLSKPIVIFLFTEKWIAIVPLLQWMFFARFFSPISALNLNLLNAIGRSDLFLKVDLLKLPITLLAMIITIPLGLKAMIIGHVVTTTLSYFINAYMPGKIYGYGAFEQLKDMFPFFLATVGMSISVILLTFIIENLTLQLFFGALLGMGTYLFACWLLKLDELTELTKTVKQSISYLRENIFFKF